MIVASFDLQANDCRLVAVSDADIERHMVAVFEGDMPVLSLAEFAVLRAARDVKGAHLDDAQARQILSVVRANRGDQR